MTTTTNTTGTLYVALELGCDKWVLASATQAAEKPRFRTVAARNLAALKEEIAKAKARFGLPADAPVCTCYEAGRDGFWLHRALTKMGIANVVVDASSIEVNRRQKQVKSDQGAEGGHRGARAQVVDRAVALSGPGRVARGGPGERLAFECEFNGAASRQANGRRSRVSCCVRA